MSLMFPKPEKPRRGDAECRRWMDEVAKQPCIICSAWPVQLHHCAHGRYAQRRSSDFDVIPLCPTCHDFRTDNGKTWEAMHGPDHSYLPLVRATAKGTPS